MDRINRTAVVLFLLLALGVPGSNFAGLASTTTKHKQHSASAGKHPSSTGNKRHSASASSKHHIIASSSHVGHHPRHHRHNPQHRHQHHVIAQHHAYPVNMFLLVPPGFTSVALSHELTKEVKEDFENGVAGVYPAPALVQAGLVSYLPLHGGIFWRRESVKYLIMHSTETVVPRNASQVVNGWNSLGRRHAGAQYIVDRDGQIYETVDPDLATVHVNIFKTLPGINNDNSIGIEMVHAGKQQYTHDQLKSVVHLVVYLLQRYQIDSSNLITHRYAQQGDHTDPVAFNWDSFIAQVDKLQKHAIAKEMVAITQSSVPSTASGHLVPAATTTVPSAASTAPAPSKHITSGAAEAATTSGAKSGASLKGGSSSKSDTELRPAIETDPSAAKNLLQSK